jgi:3-demethoxyubiquinol 3-hydroxylase
MKADEVTHALTAVRLGAEELPRLAKGAMKVAAKVMTGTAYWI